ncbi:MAG: hypothetical protein WCF67_22785, partial [Chitinophagaceae bacterium]
DKMIDNYMPPIVLNFPKDLTGIDNQVIKTSNYDNQLSTYDTNATLSDKINRSQEGFLQILFDYLIIPSECQVTFEKRPYVTYQTIQERNTSQQIKQYADIFINNYFSKIKSTQI